MDAQLTGKATSVNGNEHQTTNEESASRRPEGVFPVAEASTALRPRGVRPNKVRSAIKSGDTQALGPIFEEGLRPSGVRKKGWTFLACFLRQSRGLVFASFQLL